MDSFKTHIQQLDEKIKWNKKLYQSGDDYMVRYDDDYNGPSFNISVNGSAGWSTDPHSPNELRLMERGRRLATWRMKSGNVEKMAQELIDIANRTTEWTSKLKVKDVADILRIGTDMSMAARKKGKLKEMRESASENRRAMADGKRLGAQMSDNVTTVKAAQKEGISKSSPSFKWFEKGYIEGRKNKLKADSKVGHQGYLQKDGSLKAK